MAEYVNAEIKIRSVIEDIDPSGLTVGDPEVTERVCRGRLRPYGTGYELTYTESEEGQSTDTQLFVSAEGEISLRRSGAIDSELRFSPLGVYTTLYSVGPYKFDMTVRTKKIRSSLGALGGQISLVYEMTLGGSARLSRMKIEVRAEE